jgi:dienelactone hydrolase
MCRFLVVLSALSSAPLAAQARPIVPATDYGKWESPGQAALSPNGAWFAWGVTRVDETSELRVRRLDRPAPQVIAQASQPVFSANSAWLLFTVQSTPAEREKLEREKKPVRGTTTLLDLATGNMQPLGQATVARFSANGRFVALRLHPADATKRDAADLLVRDLVAGTTQVVGNVAAFQWSDAGALLAMTMETDGNAGNGVQLLDAGTGRLVTLASSLDRYRGLAWRRAADDLVVLRTQSTPAYRDTNHVVLAWRGLAGTPTSLVLDPATSGAMTSELRISESRVPEWSRDGASIVIGLRPRDLQRDTTRPAAGQLKPSDVQVWHASDVRPIPMQKVQDALDARRTLAAVWWPAEGRVVRVQNDLMDQVTLAEQGRVAVAITTSPYPWNQMFGRRRVDVEAIDLATGQRRQLGDSVRFTGGLSPRGTYYAFFADGRWRIANTSTGTVVPANVPGAEFQQRDTDSPTDEFGPFGFGGWSSDERLLFVYDKYDIWRIAADGQAGTRLTNGASERLVHRFAAVAPFGRGSAAIDVAKPVWIHLTGEWSKETGYARLLSNGIVERATIGTFTHAGLLKADSVETVAFSRERFDTPPTWFVANADLKSAPAVGTFNAFHGQQAWGRAELVEFTSDSGRRQQGALYYPANYDPSKKYPMIVNTYELMSQDVHRFMVPSERTYYNRTVWTQQGYFVFTPDIVFRWGDPGRSYMESLVPAVKTVIAMGVVDSARIGLVGHSWGGYEATYAPTQTNLFATSIAGAPITNFLSFAGAFHWSAGMPEFDHWETGQGRMVKPPWEDFEGHVRNSPAAFIHKLERPMLMMFGDADGTVDWHQGVEFYNFARRAGKKDFVMLVYPGEDHGLRKKENQVDYHRRILEWFGHYLKGEPAPEWITRGITWQERKSAVVSPIPDGGK